MAQHGEWSHLRPGPGAKDSCHAMFLLFFLFSIDNLDISKAIDVLSHFLIHSGITSIEQHFDKVNDEK
jgi:hypothetical protein